MQPGPGKVLETRPQWLSSNQAAIGGHLAAIRDGGRTLKQMCSTFESSQIAYFQ